MVAGSPIYDGLILYIWWLDPLWQLGLLVMVAGFSMMA